jgi:hypothetical protein
MKLSLVGVLLISSVTNQQQTPVDQKAHLDQEFQIKIGRESLVDTLKIKFDAVAKDSRCPCGHQCASFNNAVVLLRVGVPESEPRYVVLNTDTKPKESPARGYKIILINLDPCPEENEDIDRDEYEATLIVTKSQTATGGSYQGSNASLQGENKPNFSGTWSFAGVDAGTTIRVVHSGKKLEISFEGFAMGRASVTRNVYYIDGRPHTTTQTEYSKRRSTNKIENYKTSKSRSIVGWDGDKLVFGGEGEESKWELSESGLELILGEGKRRTVYRRIP